MTKNSEECPQCGAPLSANAPAGLCPRCVMAMNMASETDFAGEGQCGPKKFQHPPTPEELAEKFPQLEILELLGRGGMGAVYKARQKELDRIVALKILPPGIGDDPAFAERFSREAKALAKLNHPNIVTLYEFGRADGLFFFLMEFVDGVNLQQLLETGRVASREALAIVPQICDALQFAHDHGIVHRDIKPDNILMDRRGRVKVADFGLAKIVEQAGADLPGGEGVAAAQLHLTGVMGTLQYMAPEQRDRPAEVDHRADIYALGVVFYQMLTGELPGKKLEAPSSRMRGGVKIDVRLDEIVLRALEISPELRYQTAADLKTRVETMGSVSQEAEVPISPQHSTTARIWTWVGIVNTGFVLFIALWFASGKAFSLPVALLVACILATVFDLLVMGRFGPSGSQSPGFKGNWLQRELMDKPNAARWMQMGCFAGALVLFVLGIWALPEEDHDLFIGVLLVSIVSFSAVALGLLVRPASASSETRGGGEGPNPPKTTGRKIMLGSLALPVVVGVTFLLTHLLWQSPSGTIHFSEQGLFGWDAVGPSPTEFTSRVVRIQDESSKLAEEPRTIPYTIYFKLVRGKISPHFPNHKKFAMSLPHEEGIDSVGRFKLGQEVTFLCSAGDGAARVMKNVPSFADLKERAQRDTAANGSRLDSSETAESADEEIDSRNEWHKRIAAMNEMDWRGALAVANEVAALPPEEGLAVVLEHWATVTNPESRKQFLKSFTFADHPHLLPVLGLGYLDPSPPVQAWAISYLKGVALRDFAEDYGAGKTWLAAHRNMVLADVLAESARTAAINLWASDPEIVRRQLKDFRYISMFRNKPEAVAGSGLEEALKPIINGDDQSLVEEALRGVAVESVLSPAWYQEVILPKIQAGNSPEVRAAASTVLSIRGGDWAVDPLLRELTNSLASERGEERLFAQFSGALGSIGEPRAIPTMIALIEADNTYDTVYGIGYFGLGKLTGVQYDGKHDGAWWRDWWANNKQRYPAVRDREIPRVSPVKSSVNVAARTDALEGSVGQVQEAAEKGSLLEMGDALKAINETCDQLQGKNQNNAPSAEEWGVDAATHREILKLLAGLENDAEGMHSIAHHEKVPEDERAALMKQVWEEQFRPRYARLTKLLRTSENLKGSGATTIETNERLAGGDPKKVFLLFDSSAGAVATDVARPLLLVLPGGDGGRDFESFIRRVSENALPREYLVAQLVAPKWDEAQFERLVWPTETNPYPEMAFSTEQFVEAVIEEIEKEHKLDSSRIFTLAWSSGGPAGYAVLLNPGTRVTGSVVAMSVFKANQLPDLNAAKGKACHILHSPQDFIPMRMAELARDILATHGASTHLQTYEGGHGWHGDVFGNIRKGVEWLEEKTPASQQIRTEGDASPQAQEQEAFGPETERVLQLFGFPGPITRGLDLDRNRFVDMPDGPNRAIDVSDLGIDLMVIGNGEGDWRLLTTARLAFLDEEAWLVNDSNTVFEAFWEEERRLNLEKESGDFGWDGYVVENETFPITLAFETARGTQGLLQILGETLDPPGLRARYKYVRKRSGLLGGEAGMDITP